MYLFSFSLSLSPEHRLSISSALRLPECVLHPPSLSHNYIIRLLSDRHTDCFSDFQAVTAAIAKAKIQVGVPIAVRLFVSLLRSAVPAPHHHRPHPFVFTPFAMLPSLSLTHFAKLALDFSLQRYSYPKVILTR